MSTPHSKLFFAALLSASFALTGCLDTGMKKLGTKTSTGSGSESTDSDSFSITLAYRADVEPDTAASRVVQIQGVRNLASASLVNLCGSLGTTCTCDFYSTTTGTATATEGQVGLSEENNSFSCSIPAASDPDDFTWVRIRTTDSTKSTGFIKIATTLTLQDVIGDLSTSKVNKIYKYSCSRYFFEGEGVNASSITCRTDLQQRLGRIRGVYNFYLKSSDVPYADQAFDTAICNRSDTLKIDCDPASKSLRYGLYSESANPFTVQIQMTSAPAGDNTSSVYGYAALPDSAGNCPTGLIKIRPWVAQPPSITSSYLEAGSPPSNFINSGNTLNDTVVEESRPANFKVYRQKNLVPCQGPSDATPGSCATASFNVETVAKEAIYTSLTPIVCAIPSSLLNNI